MSPVRKVSAAWRRELSPWAPVSVALLGLLASPLAAQVPAEPASPEACLALTADAERLACYDRALGRESPSQAPGELAAEPSSESEVTTRNEASSLLDSRWELLPESKLGTFSMRAYQPVYLLPWVGATDVNQFPSSPAPNHTVETSEQLDSAELAFQISLKTKAWQGIFGRHGDLWLAYTQSSRLQLFNSERSRPFRETNYEPEVLLVFATRYHLFGWDGRLLSAGINHVSNGRSEPRSRSWNRLTASIGLEREGWTLTLRPWWRVGESDTTDDNPDIEDYLGRADLLLVRHVRNHELALMVRHSLRGGDRSHGAVELNWAFPWRGNLRGRVQLFHGYGESLIDYNFRSTRLGLGLSLIEWY